MLSDEEINALSDEEAEHLYQQTLMKLLESSQRIIRLTEKQLELRKRFEAQDIRILELELKTEARDKYLNGEKPSAKKAVKNKWKWLNWKKYKTNL